jgi:DNA-packaging protein gp3
MGNYITLAHPATIAYNNRMTNPPHRPRIIKSPEEFDAKVDDYVAKQKQAGKPILLTGMILHLGLHSRESLDEYRNYDGFSDSVSRAKMLIQSAYEEKLHDDPKSTNGSNMQFVLKNMSWSDKVDLNHGGQNGTNPIDTKYTIEFVNAPKRD